MTDFDAVVWIVIVVIAGVGALISAGLPSPARRP